MPTVTLAESAKLSQNDLVAGVIENIITVDHFFEILPFDGIEGNALAYNRENALGPVATVGVGETIGPGATGGANLAARQAAKNPATFTEVTASLTTIMGDAEVNGLIQATRSNVNDQTAVQIGSKAKSAGRQYRDMLINGTGANNQFEGLINLCPAGQTVSAGTNGAAISFELLDELLDLVVDRDGEVDYILMHARTIRSYKALLRALGGASINEVVTLPSGRQQLGYSGVPIFRNDYIPINQTQGSINTATSVFAGTIDDGSRSMGIAGLTAENEAGIVVQPVGYSETKDEFITRVKWYSGLALFSEKGIACIEGVNN